LSHLFGFTTCQHFNRGGSLHRECGGGDGIPITVGYRWLLEEDNTNVAVPGKPVSDSISLSIHKSHAPVLKAGRSDAASTTIDAKVSKKTRYFVSVLPDSGYAMGGAVVEAKQGNVTITVQKFPIPTAQISILAFVDQGPINNAFDEGEQGLGGCTIKVEDGTVGGPISQDAFGNPLGTVYALDAGGNPIPDPATGYQILTRGTGVITTLTKAEFDAGQNPYNLKVGEALVKFLPPGKYGIILVPPTLDDGGNQIKWVQTTTIEGTPVIDAWVKANEPTIFIEGFGTGFKHTTFGFVIDPSNSFNTYTYRGQTYEKTPWNKNPKEDFPATGATGTITGTLRANHFARPPRTQGYFAGEFVPECWVGLDDPTVAREVPLPGGGETFTKNGRIIVQCDANSNFTISDVPPGLYQLVWWDTPLDYLFGFQSVTVPVGGGTVALGDILAFRWFGTLMGTVFNDTDEDGFRDPAETGISNVPLNIRFRDGRIYQATVTDITGEYEFGEVFPFFKWLVAEVGFTNFKATGMTAVADAGGGIVSGGKNIVPPHNGWAMPSFDKLNPQPQVTPPSWPANGPPSATPILNPNTGNNLSRTETGPVLLQATQTFLNQTNYIDWGKKAYGPGENGGIAGIVYYAITRAEDDPALAVGEPWEPGIPRVQVNLYLADANGNIVDLNGDGLVTLADVDNYPLGKAAGVKGSKGNKKPPDVNRNKGGFSAGDAINIAWTDSWDDNLPTGCIQPLPIVHGRASGECADAFSTWNQIRPGVFDGGYAFTDYFVNAGGFAVPWGTNGAIERALPPGNYIVEVTVPPGYILAKEEDKNVDFGDENIPGLLATPYQCVNYDENNGQGHLVPPYLSLFPDQQIPAPFTGQYRPLCDRKLVTLSQGQNAPADFFLFTEVPKAARAFGFTNNDLSAEFNVFSPNFGEKLAPSWIPVSFRDWTGKEIVRVYTDEFGHYNALLPSTFSVNAPSPSGVAPNMMTLILNDPTFADGTRDPYYNPTYTVTPWTFHYLPGSTTYLDTPLIPQAAFAAAGVAMDTNPSSGTPVIAWVDGPENGTGPIMCTSRLPLDETQRTITIQSIGKKIDVLNPNYDPTGGRGAGNKYLKARDFSFGSRGIGNNRGNVYLNGAPLTITKWNKDTITAVLPPNATTGRLMVQRGNGNWTEIGVTFNVVDCATTTVINVNAGQSIQNAIDTASAGALIVVAPGTYNENVVMHKPVRLQGAGAWSTFINADPNPLDRLQAWHDRIDALGGAEYEAFLLKKIFYQNEAPGIAVIGEITYPGGTVQFPDEANPKTLNPGNPFNTEGQAKIDGFTILGSKAGGGIAVFSAARYLEVSNNNIQGNSGNDAGAISWGVSNIGFDQQNTNGRIFGNKLHKNGGVQGAGAIGMYEYSNNYMIDGNLITGNFSRFNGGAISHWGLSPGVGTIQNNRILFNECFFGAILNQAGHGGGIYIGGEVLGVDGSGSVTIDSNLIQGNLTGSGFGGGIRAFGVNGLDVSLNPADPTQWHELRITNNTIVNNVAALAGGGIALQDVARATISGNTIARNDGTATAALAFTAGQPNSNPQPAGIVSSPHSAVLRTFLGGAQDFSNPTLDSNIIWQNRSFYYAVTDGIGSLVPNPLGPYWDLNVIGSVSSADPHLSPMNGTLTSLTDPKTGFSYSITNTATDPLFVQPYFNTLQSAAVVDEGGNSINVLFSPLVPTGSYQRQ
jgi:parallel beta-helix repeat protein